MASNVVFIDDSGRYQGNCPAITVPGQMCFAGNSKVRIVKLHLDLEITDACIDASVQICLTKEQAENLARRILLATGEDS